MRPPRTIRHEFVEFVPKAREEGVLYISIPYTTAVHSCFCGCGLKVVTPIRPTEWQLTFDGETVTLWPSVGNWDYPCASHYWIRNDRAIWAPPMTRAQIEGGRVLDQDMRERYFTSVSSLQAAPAKSAAVVKPTMVKPKRGFWGWLTGRD